MPKVLAERWDTSDISVIDEKGLALWRLRFVGERCDRTLNLSSF
jgi:hypothetical protein